jgi:hypothetical protein
MQRSKHGQYTNISYLVYSENHRNTACGQLQTTEFYITIDIISYVLDGNKIPLTAFFLKLVV